MCATVRNVSFGGPVGSHIQRIQRVPGSVADVVGICLFEYGHLLFGYRHLLFGYRHLLFGFTHLKYLFVYILGIN